MSNSFGRGVARFLLFVRKIREAGRDGKEKIQGIGAEGDGNATCLDDGKYSWQSPKARTNRPEKSLLRSPMSAKTGGLLG